MKDLSVVGRGWGLGGGGGEALVTLRSAWIWRDVQAGFCDRVGGLMTLHGGWGRRVLWLSSRHWNMFMDQNGRGNFLSHLSCFLMFKKLFPHLAFSSWNTWQRRVMWAGRAGRRASGSFSVWQRAQGAKSSVRVSKQSTSLHPWLAGHGDSGLPAGNGKANWGEPFHPMLLVQPLLAHRTLWEVFCGLWSSVVKYKRLKMNCRGSGGKWQWDLPGPSDVFTLRKSRLQSSNIGIKRGREKPHLDHMRLAGLRALKALLRASVSGAPTAHKVKHPHFSLVELWGLSEDAGHVPRWEDLHLTGQWELRQDIYSWWGPSWDSLERSN